jgi:hypothetical protein
MMIRDETALLANEMSYPETLWSALLLLRIVKPGWCAAPDLHPYVSENPKIAILHWEPDRINNL